MVGELEQAREQVEQLQQALDGRVVIEQAKGVLSERFGWTIADSFEILRYTARSSRAPIRSIAEAVVGSGETPNAMVVALARSERWRAASMRERGEAQRERSEDLNHRIRAQQQRLAQHRKP
jgi:hypothetical protein